MLAQRPSTAKSAAGLGELAEWVGRMGRYVEHLRERMGLLEAVVDNFPGGISLFNKNLAMVLCNEQQKALLEYPEELFKGRRPTLEELFHFNAERGEYGPGSVELHVARRMALVGERTAHTYERTRPNGMVVEVRGVPLEGGGFVTTYIDVTEQRRNQQLVAHMAHHDPLTDLPNRLLFNDRLKNAVALVKRRGALAVHYIDVDNFKPVNDNLGHQAGDELLVGIAGRLASSVRENDTVARLGGDEFAIVQTGIASVADAEVLARRVLKAFRTPFAVTGKDVDVSASIGISFAPRDGLSCDELLRKADTALYDAKNTGRQRFCFFEKDEAA